ncbi:MAG: hypothetical protein ACTSR8_16640 [Promethearchaeota archaeon]
MSEEQIKSMFEKFSSKFEETMFTLIAKFNEISDGFSRVQEALDFLGKIRIQTAENKQIMSSVEKAFKNLERKLREMSLGGFEIPAIRTKPKATVADDGDDLSALLSAPVSSESSKSDDLSDLGDISQLPSVDEIVKRKEGPTTAPTPPKPEPTPTAPTPTTAPTPPKPEPTPTAPTPTTAPAPPKPEPTPTAPTPTTAPTPPKPEPTPTAPTPTTAPTPLEPEPTLTPVPKFEPKTSLIPTPKKSEVKSEPILPEPVSEITASKPRLTPTPVLKAGKSTAPKLQPKTSLPPVPKKPQQPKEVSQVQSPSPAPAPIDYQRKQNINGIQDVWYNLQIDVKEAKNYENIAVSLGLANEYLKQFVKFHKVLFEILKVASEYRRKGQNEEVSNEEREHLLKIIESWKFQLR